jgi:hypothetical protein
MPIPSQPPTCHQATCMHLTIPPCLTSQTSRLLRCKHSLKHLAFTWRAQFWEKMNTSPHPVTLRSAACCRPGPSQPVTQRFIKYILHTESRRECSEVSTCLNLGWGGRHNTLQGPHATLTSAILQRRLVTINTLQHSGNYMYPLLQY